MNNETQCEFCGKVVSLDEVQYVDDSPACKDCVLGLKVGDFVHDCKNSLDDGCRTCAEIDELR